MAVAAFFVLEFRFDPSSPVRFVVRRLVMSERQVMGDGDEGEMGSGPGKGRRRRRRRRGSRMERAGQIATGSPRTKTELSVVT